MMRMVGKGHGGLEIGQQCDFLSWDDKTKWVIRLCALKNIERYGSFRHGTFLIMAFLWGHASGGNKAESKINQDMLMACE